MVLREGVLLMPGERVIREEEVKYDGGLTYLGKRVKGCLTMTNQRLLFIARRGQLAKEERVVINVFLSCVMPSEIKTGLLKEVLIVPFEDWYGIMQRPRFKTSNASLWMDAINSIALTQESVKPISEKKKEIERFRKFVSFLSVEKFVRPLLFDPVSRVIRVGDQQAFIDSQWNVEAPPELRGNLKRWLTEFLKRR